MTLNSEKYSFRAPESCLPRHQSEILRKQLFQRRVSVHLQRCQGAAESTLGICPQIAGILYSSWLISIVICTHDDGMISSSFLSFREKDLDRFFKGYGRKTDVLIKQVTPKAVCNVGFSQLFSRALDLLSLKIIGTLMTLFMNSMAKTFWVKGRKCTDLQ